MKRLIFISYTENIDVTFYNEFGDMITPEDLIKEIKLYSPNINEDLIKQSYLYAMDKHGTQIRESGELYFSHPVAVAQILIELKMDQVTIVSGLLHDTIEDTSATVNELKEKFGSDVARIVDGVTKLTKFEDVKIAKKQSENYKKLLLSAASDIRVLIIKLADRLHNMRTLKFKKRKSRRSAIAQETLEVYAPLAERIGLRRIKDELQDIAFYELYPDLYNSIRNKLKTLYDSSEEVINTIKLMLDEVVKQLNINYTITGRLKTPYSIWNKMNVRTISFEQLSDIMAFRIVVDNIQQCYQMLGLIHRHYLVIPGRFRDYISTPKNNKYQSLHTCVIGPLNKRIEIQIRTREMHLMAEYGIAAHWEYKEGKGNKQRVNSNYQWLKNMVQILDNTSKMDEFIEYSKTEILAESVFCITPKGELIPLPVGSSILDFAYAIHSEVGNHAIGARVNNKEVPLKTIIENGDQIEIITDKNSFPKGIWQSYVKTIKAKTAIRRALTSIETDHTEIIGKNNFDNIFKENHVSISADEFNSLLQSLKFDTPRQLYLAIGNSSVTIQEIVSKYNELYDKRLSFSSYNNGNTISNPILKSIIGLPNTDIIEVKCCSPVPGDKIIGVAFPDKGIEVHIEECKVLRQELTNMDVRIIELYWDPKFDFSKHEYSARLLILTISQPGNLAKISSVIENRHSSILNLKIGERFENFSELYIEFYVSSLSQLNMIITDLSSSDFVNKVKRT